MIRLRQGEGGGRFRNNAWLAGCKVWSCPLDAVQPNGAREPGMDLANSLFSKITSLFPLRKFPVRQLREGRQKDPEQRHI